MTIFEYLDLSKDNLATMDIGRNYVSYRIKKRDGKRTRRIDAPLPELKAIQRKILRKIFYNYKAHPIAHGFIKNRSPRTNAECHIGKKCVVQVDIQDFFPSITTTKVQGLLTFLFKHQDLFDIPDEPDTALIAKVLCLNGVVPQGSPASPALTNLLCFPLDAELEKLQKRFDCTITRYADDITASTDNVEVVGELLRSIKHLLLYNGFKVNGKKVKISKYFKRQQITGIVVNEKLNTPKISWRNLRAALHQSAKITVSEKTQQQLRGQIEWLKSLNPTRGDQFIKQFGLLNVEKLSTSS
jgi:retron-type reverse transcriptase